MSLLRRLELEIMDHPFFYPPHSSSFLLADTSSFFLPPRTLALPPLLEDLHEDIFHGLDLMTSEPYPFDLLDTVTDVVRMERAPFQGSHYRRVQRRTSAVDSCLLTLADRISALEHKFERLLSGRSNGERKYTFTAEIEGKEVDRKYKWTAEMKPGKEKGECYKWVAEVKEKGESGERTYKWLETSGSEDKKHKKKDKEKEKKGKKDKAEFGTRLVEIEEPADHRAVVLRQVSVTY